MAKVEVEEAGRPVEGVRVQPRDGVVGEVQRHQPRRINYLNRDSMSISLTI